jgi:hypothetical protein
MDLTKPPLFGFEPQQGPATGLLACVNFLPDHMEGCAKGYRQAAELLTKALSNNAGHLDYLVYPMVFLWRHYLELMLKVLRERLGGPGQLHHRLNPLWKDCRRLLTGPRIEVSAELLELIERRVTEFDDFDPDSMVFRYTKDKAGNNIVPGHRKHVDLGILHQQMTRLGDLLEDLCELLNR